MDRCIDETWYVMCLQEFENNKKYKKQILHEISSIVCAMLNSNGGKVVIHFDTDGSVPVEDIPSKVIGILEHRMISIIGKHQTVLKMDFQNDTNVIIICIKKANNLVTNNYNLYLPSETQVVDESPLEPLENLKNDIMYRKVIPDPVELGSHCKIFLKDEKCGLHESKMSQLKNLKADPSKRTTLADRMTGKGNKFSCYVSAFANHSGGHIYYGITDDGVVEGEFIPDEEKKKIIKQVEKSINQMIWPEQIGRPKRGEHWEIFFEPVMDENSKPVPSTFVIVIYIVPCLGGVFTEEPECYEMVDGIVSKMSFDTWKKRISRPLWLRCKYKILPAVSRTTWSSAAVRKAFTNTSEKLRELINYAKWHDISKLFESLQKPSHPHEMKLAVLSKQVTACCRRGHFNNARSSLDEYQKISLKVKDALIFEVLHLHLRATLDRATGDLESLKETLSEALLKAELIEPGLVTATVYAFAATVSDLIKLGEPTDENSPEFFSIKAREHSRYEKDCPHFSADKAQKAFIILATFHLGCNLSGKQRLENIKVDTPDLDEAKNSLMAVQQSICDGNPLSWYREIQLNLVQSIYYYRHSQVLSGQRDHFLRSAINYAKRAESLARYYQFSEMVEWSKVNKVLCIEELVRAKLLNLKFKRAACQ